MLYNLATHAVVGIDMNAEEIRLLRLRGQRIEVFAIADLPPGAITGNQIRQAKTVQSILKNLVNSTGSAGCHAVLAIPASQAILKLIKTASKPNLQQYVTGDANEYCFDYYLLTTGETALVAARREQVNQLIAITAYAGLKIKVVEIDSYALERASANPFSKMTLAKCVDKETFSQHAARLELCRGLALRKIPR